MILLVDEDGPDPRLFYLDAECLGSGSLLLTGEKGKLSGAGVLGSVRCRSCGRPTTSLGATRLCRSRSFLGSSGLRGTLRTTSSSTSVRPLRRSSLFLGLLAFD